MRQRSRWVFFTSPQKQKGTPLVDVPSTVMIASATPYAGITQVRFEGYHLSLYGTPGSAIQLYFEFTSGEKPNQAIKTQEKGAGKRSYGQIGLEMRHDHS
jgi:hypothetical protein